MRRPPPIACVLALLLYLLPAGSAWAQDLRLQGLRGATTARANTPEAIRQAVSVLMEELVRRNRLVPERVVSATFTATADLDALFPASIARRLSGWDGVALLDMQQLAVRGDLARCIRVLVLAWVPQGQPPQHVYQGEAARLRPDRASRP
jgi:chorismate mutase